MKVVILCGGKGTRLREETEYRPKPMVMIGGRPMLWHIMKYYAHFGHKEFILCLGYRGDMIKDFFKNYLWNTCDVTLTLGRNPNVRYHTSHAEEDWTVTLAETGQESMTGERIRRIQSYIDGGEEFLLTYGDGLSDIDIGASIETHRNSGRICTIAAVHPASRFGTLEIEEDGGVREFAEKPQLNQSYVNGGFMVCQSSIFNYLEGYENPVFEKEPLSRLATDGQMNAYRHQGWWQSMDTYRESQLLNDLWRSGQAPWKVW
ncbi:MAG: glucose-1-phosphate cytidylyltransferase [Puniceicoccaceae bacterium]